mmetsp:Transcript_268/g.664  ORF Transcript_268/g.664 Transcript_268/m.664 type:complete len:209 (-) Transcript_268:13-639(-)
MSRNCSRTLSSGCRQPASASFPAAAKLYGLNATVSHAPDCNMSAVSSAATGARAAPNASPRRTSKVLNVLSTTSLRCLSALSVASSTVFAAPSPPTCRARSFSAMSSSISSVAHASARAALSNASHLRFRAFCIPILTTSFPSDASAASSAILRPSSRATAANSCASGEPSSQYFRPSSESAALWCDLGSALSTSRATSFFSAESTNT